MQRLLRSQRAESIYNDQIKQICCCCILRAQNLRERKSALSRAGVLSLFTANRSTVVKQGIVDESSEAFYLTLYNPYNEYTDFVAYPVGINDENPQVRVTVYPDEAMVGAQRSRQLIVIANGLMAGEVYQFRVCAQRKTPPEGIMINARVCSKISAHRVG
jgi:hypothetical protein